MKNYYKPQELVFEVDDGINRAVDLAVQKYQEAVGKSICLYQMYLETVSCFDRPTVRCLSADCRFFVGQLSVFCRPTVGRLSANCPSSVG